LQFATIFGGLSAVLAFLPIFADPPGLTRAGRLLLIAGLLGGVTAAVLSGSRGVWVACTVLLLWRVGRAKPLVALLLLIFIVGASSMLPMLAGRWNAAMSDLLLYSDGNSETALGFRLEIWQAAWAAFTSHPLFGIGPTNFHDWLQARAQSGIGPATLANFDHAHNDLLHAAATGGLVQGTALAIAFWLPWRYFYRINASRFSPSARAGLMLIVAFLVLGLTDAFLTFRVALTLYVAGISLLVGWAGVEANADAVGTKAAGAGS
jgi:O-antigen ligase